MPTYTPAPRAATLPHILRRIVAMTSGGALLAVLAHAIVATTGQTGAHALVTYAIAAGIFVAAWVLGDAAVSKTLRACLVAAMIAGELGNIIASGELVVARRDTAAAAHRVKQGAHDHAVRVLSDADAALKAARDAVSASASQPGCKDRCVTLLNKAVADATAARAAAAELHDANPAPATSAAPLAERIGIAAWALDLILAGLMAIGGNGLAAALIAYGSHGAPRMDQQTSFPTEGPLPSPGTFAPFEDDDSAGAVSAPEARSKEREQQVRSFVEAYRAKHGRNPTPAAVRRATGIPRASAHRWQQKVQRAAAG